MFVPHIEGIVSNSEQMLGYIKRYCQDFLNIDTIRILYLALVRVHLESAASVWSPHYSSNIVTLGRVQPMVMKFVAFNLTPTGIYIK